MERYIYVKSNESDKYFSDNKVCRFKVHLSLPLTLDGKWKVALTEFYASNQVRSRKKETGALYIFTDLCKESIVHGVEQPLLRRLNMNATDAWDYSMDSPYYLPVKKREVREFEIYIKSEDDNFASNLQDPLNLTLHLKQYPFF